MNVDLIGQMSCNPAVGGIAKGHLVREVDALGGIMGEVTDAVGIQFRLLNTSRGPAVWSPRAQADKREYGAWVRDALEREPNISWIVGRAGRILVEHGRVAGLALEDGDVIASTHRVFSFNGRGRNATAIDAKTDEVVGTIALDAKPEFAVSDDKGHVYVNLEDKSSIAAIDSRQLTVTSVWPIAGCESPSGLALDVAGRRKWPEP